MNIRKVLLVAVVAILPWTVVAEAQKDDAVKEDMKKLQGVWKITKWIDSDGRAAPADELKGTWFEFEGDQMTKKGNEARQPVKYTLNASKKPKWFDTNLGSKVIEGIYKLDGDVLTICVISGGSSDQPPERPTEFKADKKKHHTYFVLQKSKK